MNKRISAAAALAALCLTPAAAQAATCPFNVDAVMLIHDGHLHVRVSQGGVGGGWTLCSVSAHGAIAADTCKAMLGLLTTARAADRPIAIDFPSASNCTVGGANGPPAFWTHITPNALRLD